MTPNQLRFTLWAAEASITRYEAFATEANNSDSRRWFRKEAKRCARLAAHTRAQLEEALK